MIRFKSILKRYPNGLTWADYHYEDVPSEKWHVGILNIIELIKEDSKEGWQLIFSNLLSSLKSSVFYPIMTSFSDWNSDYALGDRLIKFNSQQGAIIQYYNANIRNGKEAGDRIYPEKTGKGSRWLFGDQLRRVKSYTKDKLLEMLYDFASLGRAIPISGWENNIGYGEKIKVLCESYNKYLVHAYLLPPSWYIENEVHSNSWLKVLIEANILGSGTSPTPRGFRCIAKDGHVCNSLVELEIDNWLFDHEIKHEKEPLYPAHNKLNPSKRLRADFLIDGVWTKPLRGSWCQSAVGLFLSARRYSASVTQLFFSPLIFMPPASRSRRHARLRRHG